MSFRADGLYDLRQDRTPPQIGKPFPGGDSALTPPSYVSFWATRAVAQASVAGRQNCIAGRSSSITT